MAMLRPDGFPHARATYTVACNRDSTPLLEVMSPQSADLLDFKLHYEVVDKASYICFVPLISTYCLLPDVKAAVDSNFHILDLIQPHIRVAAAEGRCLLCLDASSEGDPFLPAAYDHLHRWLAEHNIPQSSVLIASQNRLLGAIYKAHTGGDIEFIEHDFYIKTFLRYFSAEPEPFAEHFGFAPSQIQIDLAQPKPNTFLCMNGAPRPNRLMALAALQATDLLALTQWSMLGDRAGKLSPSVIHARDLRDVIGADWISDESIDQIMAATPRVLPGEEADISGLRDSNQLANTINLTAFQSSFASIVTETEYSGGDVRRVTEKTVRAFAMGHPTVVIGNPGSLALMRELGFESFSDVFDESYDAETDGGRRIVSIIETLRQVEALRQSPAKIARLEEICRANLDFTRSRAVQAYDERIETLCVSTLMIHLARLQGAQV
jgi:hypothetical protein